MTIKEMIEVMQAYLDGKNIEYSPADSQKYWNHVIIPSWNWDAYDYRVAPEPKKESRWERVEIKLTGDSLYMFRCPHQDNVLVGLSNAAIYPGLGGIDYQSPFDPKVIVRSMVPLMFDTKGFWIHGFDENCRPGIPVAAWFWKEGGEK